MVVFDATMLLFLLWRDAPAPIDHSTGKPIDGAAERVDHLIKRLEKDKTKIIIPTPALSEILVRVGNTAPDYVEKIERSSVFRVASFDTRAAIEVALMTRSALQAGDKTDGGEGPWAKIKYDRQIIAITKAEGASIIYSDDKNVAKFGRAAGLTVIGLAACPLPNRPEEPPLLKLLDEKKSGGDNEGQ